MSNDFKARLAAIDQTILTPLVRQALASDAAEVFDWSYQPVMGGGTQVTGRGFGVYRFSGQATTHKDTVSWSLILKALGPAAEGRRNDPAYWDYWKREPLLYQSGLLNDLPSCGLVAPRCFGVVDYPGQEYWMWLEDIVDDTESAWSLEQYRVVAHHLGQFNGAYYVGKAVPTMPWLSTGRIRDWLKRGEDILRDLRNISKHPLARLWLNEERVERILRLWSEREIFLEAIDRLPRSFCHHDAFRRNLIIRRDSNGHTQTVAVDWAIAGMGVIGEEIATMVTVSLQFLEVEISQAKALEATVFEGYLTGLRDAGWQGDEQLVRFGFVTTAALFLGVGAVGVWLQAILYREDADNIVRTVLGRPLNDILPRFALLQDYLLDLGDEARELVSTI